MVGHPVRPDPATGGARHLLRRPAERRRAGDGRHGCGRRGHLAVGRLALGQLAVGQPAVGVPDRPGRRPERGARHHPGLRHRTGDDAAGQHLRHDAGRRHGNLPDSLLASVGGGFRLAKPAADAYQRMVNAARRDGVTFGLSDGYRTYADQVDIADRLGLYGQGGVAAVPGQATTDGVAVDLDLDDRAQAWMRENGWRYGFFEDVPGEPWHWTYRA
ncbi:MAG: D-alanyl-D-alanine carboxypeptidase family protein [Acidimicrobiales bacterium]